MYELYTDGGCWPNPGDGGWAFILKDRDVFLKQGAGRLRSTTNNRVELTAVMMGLHEVPEGGEVTLYSDSQYVVNGLNEWRHSWKRYGWRNVKNADLWEELDALADARVLTAVWVRGHQGNECNELCDRMATEAYRGAP